MSLIQRLTIVDDEKFLRRVKNLFDEHDKEEGVLHFLPALREKIDRSLLQGSDDNCIEDEDLNKFLSQEIMLYFTR